MDIFGFTLSVLGIALNARKNIGCWWVWLASNIVWCWYFIHCTPIQTWALAMNVVFFAGNLYGLSCWMRERKEHPLISSTEGPRENGYKQFLCPGID